MSAALVDLSRSNCAHVSLNGGIVQSVGQRPKCFAIVELEFSHFVLQFEFHVSFLLHLLGVAADRSALVFRGNDIPCDQREDEVNK